MSSYDDDEALFEDIYDEDKTEVKKDSVPKTDSTTASSGTSESAKQKDEQEATPDASKESNDDAKASNSTPVPPAPPAESPIPPPPAPAPTSDQSTPQASNAAPGVPSMAQGYPAYQQPQDPQQLYQQTQGQVPGQYPGQVPGQYPGQMPGQVPGQYPGQMPEGQAPGQYQGQMPPQMPGQMPGQMPPQMPGQMPGQMPPQMPQIQPPSNMGKESGKMFIGGLNWDTTEQGLVEYFTKFGEVIDHTIMRDNNTGKSRGFGFLTFKDPKSVDAVISTDHVLDGKLIDPKRAIAREEQDKVGKIFVGGIDPMVNEKEFNDFFSQFGSIIDAQLMIDKDTGRSRGFGFITYDSPDAVDRVTVNKYLTLKGKSMEVKRAEPRGQHQQNQMQQQQQQQYGNFNAYGNQYGQTPYQQNASYSQGVNGVAPEMMQEYWQRMQQWYMYQQQAAQAQAGSSDYTQPQTQPQDQGEQPLNPQQQAPEQQEYQDQDNGSENPHRDLRRLNLPKGPRRAPPSGPSGNSKGRGGYHNRNRGYHPYGRSGRRN